MTFVFESRPQRWLGVWLPFWSYSMLVIQGAILPADRIPRFLLRLNDKLVHGVEYFLLFWLARRAFAASQKDRWKIKAVSIAFFYCIVMGALTEILQIWVPGRSAELADFAADGFGSAMAWGMLAAFQRTRGVRA